MTKLVTIFGGSGFVGRYIARRMAQAGWRVRVAVRRPNEAIFVKPYGSVGQVEPIGCNIRDDASVAAALSDADAVVNCVGILNEVGRNKFSDVQAEGAARIARLASEHGVSNLVHVSAIGADENGPSAYAVTKAHGEAAIQEHFPNAVILRPSIIFGPKISFSIASRKWQPRFLCCQSQGRTANSNLFTWMMWRVRLLLARWDRPLRVSTNWVVQMWKHLLNLWHV